LIDRGETISSTLKIRLDLLLVEKRLAESRAKAQALIMAGQVRVAGQVVDRVAENISPEMDVTVDRGPQFVSRGGEKLEAALTQFSINVNGYSCADVGASTGGFTDCLLQHGAKKVYAIDVGKGILHWKLRTNPRVVVMEETNARHIESLPEAIDLVVIDASFISLKIILPVVRKWLKTPAVSVSPKNDIGKKIDTDQIIALIKPQFEAGRKESAKHKGVIRDPEVHKAVVRDVVTFAESLDLKLYGLMRSPIIGPKGNIEFLAWLGVKERYRVSDDIIPTLFE
jgi:23S rRNA (cytidine1920-2'-O)/16S rRNA (cytidine1409-2'-O)-methyltransferase